MAKKICIVTPDIVGPMKNGGIGTACYWLARFLAHNGYRVTALYTGPFENSTYAEIRSKYGEDHVDFVALAELKLPKVAYYGIEHYGQVSEQVYAYLKGQLFDVVHFQDWQGNGFASIQAKTMGVAFARTKLVVGVHSPRLWEQEGMRVWPRDPITDFKRDYMEKYAIEHADAVWSPSEALLRWLQEHEIIPRGRTRVIRYLIRLDKQDEAPLTYEARDPSHLAFFGRLETRKGLELFTSALNKILDSGRDHGIKRITFLGKIGTVLNGVNAYYHLNQLSDKWKAKGIEWKVIDNFDAFQALRYIQKTGAIAVMPSLLDNYPYTVLECLENGIPCLASAVGGIPEMLGPDVIFEPKVDALCEAIFERNERVPKMRGLYSNEQAKRDWLEYSEELEAEPNPIAVAHGDPRVSVCVAYYNYGRYLPHLLRSLAENDYRNFEVIVVNDGSTDSSSIEVFRELEKKFTPRGWKFFTQENQGIGATRNFAASQATGEQLIFMDADNVATKKMISTFVKALVKSGADALTCVATVFKGHEYPDAKTEVFYLYRPIGPALEMAMLENVFGDANAIIRKKAFDAVGGFKTDRTTSFEDWEFFALLALQGHKIDVIPEQLFFYRHLGEGFSRTTSLMQNQSRVLRAFLAHQDKLDMKKLMQQLLIPFYYAKQPVPDRHIR